jgi:hypothetical protein
MIVLYEYHRQSCGAQHPVIVGLAEKSALIAMNSRDDELDFGQLQRLFQMRFLMPGLDAAPSNNLAPVSIGGKARREDDPLSIDRICRTKATLLSIVHLQPQRAVVSRYFTCRAGVADRRDLTLTWFARG